MTAASSGGEAIEVSMDVGSMTLTLPWPPTVNTYYRNIHGKTLISAKGRAYQDEVGWITLKAKCRKEISSALSVSIVAYRPDNRKISIKVIIKIK